MAWSRGVPGIEIVREAESWGADLVVIGRRGRPTGDAELLGRTVDTVVRRRTGPCLLIPPELDRLGRMMVALDGTSRGLGILPFAEAFADLLSLPATTVFTAPEEVGSHTARANLLTALIEHPLLGGSGQLEVRIGPPVEEILAACRTSGADLLVVGVRRGGPMGEAGSGHVGRDLLLKAPTAILTVPI
jgi:nucleotide-binding universal stress UspA family protein